MSRFFAPVAAGFNDSLVLAAALVEAATRGVWRVLERVVVAFIKHKPIPVGPGKTRSAG